MFAELAPLLKERTLMLTVAQIDEVQIQVNVIPKFLRAHDETKGTLTIPLSITGTAEELDRALGIQLKSFVATVVRTGSNLKEIEAKNKEALDKKRKAAGGVRAAGEEKPQFPGLLSKTGSRYSEPRTMRWVLSVFDGLDVVKRDSANTLGA
jgi:PRTRC genetic system protein E